MRKVLLLAAAAGAVAATLASTPASACFTPGGPFPTFQVCLGPDLEDILKPQ